MPKDLIEQIKMLIKHIQENPESLEKAKIYDLKSKKLLADTTQSKPQDYSIPKDAKKPQEATQATAEPVNPEFGQGSIYAIKTNHGHIIGQNISGKSPNYHDVLNWLKDKNVPAELVNPAPFNKKFASYMSENIDPHTVYETDHNDPNYIAKLDSIIEKHPNSPDYKEDNYIPKKELNENTNFAFTPLSSVDSTRFGTPDGNLWVTKTKNSHTGEVKYSIGKSKGESRLMAYQGKNLGQSGNPELMPDIAGQKQHKGNLIVGANSYLRTKVPFFIVQNLDLHPFYEKTADGYRAGVMGTYRNGSGKPLYAYSESEKSPKEALDNAINHFVLEAMKIHSKPEEPSVNFDIGSDEPDKKTQKINSWLTNSIYRSPKISLKDIVNEPQTAQKSLKDDYFESLKKAKVIDFQSRMPKKLKSPSLKAPKQTKPKKPSLKQTDPDELQRVLNDKGILTNYDMHILESRTKEIGDAIKMSDPNRDGEGGYLYIRPKTNKSKEYYKHLVKSALEKAKIYDFKTKKMLVDLPKPPVKAYLVNSDNFDNALLTPKAYKALTLEMSSGDYGSHEAKPVFDFSEHAQNDLIDHDGENYISATIKTESLLKAKVFSLASGKLQFDTSNPEHKMDTTDPSHLVAAQILPQGDPNRKRGMMVVGSNVFARQNLPEEVIQNHDVFYHFFVTPEQIWKVGATVTERNGDKGTFVEANGLDINQTLKDLNSRIKQRASSKEQDWHTFDKNKMSILNKFLYRQPKISLKDIQSLDPYKPE